MASALDASDVLMAQGVHDGLASSTASGNVFGAEYNYLGQGRHPPTTTGEWSGVSIPDELFAEMRGARDGIASNGNMPSTLHQHHPSHSMSDVELGGRPLAEIVQIDEYRRKIAFDYQRFLTTYVDAQGHSVYHARIKAMCGQNKESLEVSYVHLMEFNPFLAKLAANQPTACLTIFDEATMQIVLRLFEEYDRIKPSGVHVRLTDYPSVDHLRDLRQCHLGTLVRVTGVITRRSGVFPQLQTVKYDCGRCGAILGPFIQDCNEAVSEMRIQVCPACNSRGGPFTVNITHTHYRNYQRVTLQESPGTVPAGRLPRHKECILLWDLIDKVRPGELVDITGIYRNNFSYALNTKNGFPVFGTVLEVNHVSSGTSFSETTSTNKNRFFCPNPKINKIFFQF